MHLLSIHGKWSKHQCKGFTVFCLIVISLEIAGENRNLSPRKRNIKSCLTGKENKHICHQEDNLLFYSFDAVRVTMVTMSGLIRPESGVNARRRSCRTSVLIYLMDVPSVSNRSVAWAICAPVRESRMACCLAGARTGVVTERSKTGLESAGEFPLVHHPVTGERQDRLTDDPTELERENKSWIFPGNLHRLIFSRLAKE